VRNVFRIGCRPETLGEPKKLSFFALLGLDPLFHRLNDDPVSAQASFLRQAANLAGGLCRKPNALSDDFVGAAHCTIMHQNGDAQFSIERSHAVVFLTSFDQH
jgi:hypothetical protein